MFNTPAKTSVHHTLEMLQGRRLFTVEEQKSLKRYQQGYQGELQFARMLEEKLFPPQAVLYNLHLESDGSEAQFDCLYLARHNIYHFEVKNYQGNYCNSKDRWFHLPTKKELRTPLHQLTRANLFLQNFLLQYHISIPVKSYVICIHPHFHLYQSEINEPIIFRAQLPQFLREIQNASVMSQHEWQNIYNLIIQAHRSVSKYEQCPMYDFDSLQKNLVCYQCKRINVTLDTQKLICSHCSFVENAQSALARHIREFLFLFPEEKLTLGKIYRWCGGTFSKKRIRYLLAKKYKLVKRGRSSYYTIV